MTPDTTRPQVCIFDNDATWRREVWRDGELAYSFSAELLMTLTKEDRRRMPFYDAMMASRPWKPDALVGDPAAKDPKQPTNTTNPSARPGSEGQGT